jgi:competence protein ComEA
VGDMLRTYRGYLVSILAFALVIGGYTVFQRWPRPEPIELRLATPLAGVPESSLPATAEAPPIVVHVLGAVHVPGVYALRPGSRLHDAVRAAGGLTAEADVARVNLADYVRDAQQVHVPALGVTLPPAPTAAVLGSPAYTAGGRVNINTATAAALETLPGIGPAYAQRIVAYREEHGPFVSPEDILGVSGIGPTRYGQIKELITTQ